MSPLQQTLRAELFCGRRLSMTPAPDDERTQGVIRRVNGLDRTAAFPGHITLGTRR